MNTPASDYDELAMAALLSELREPPAAWVEAAKRLPRARVEIAGLVERAQADADYRAKVLDDLENALREDGYEPTVALMATVRAGIEAAPPER